MGASQQRRARRAQKHSEQQVIGPAQQAAANTMQDSTSIHEPQHPVIYHELSSPTQEAFSDKWQQAGLSVSSNHDFDTLSHPYHMVGGIAPETLLDTPSAASKVTTQGADCQVTEITASDIHEEIDQMAHSIASSFDHRNTKTLEPLTASATSNFAAVTATFTFESSLAFPCDFGKEQPLADFSTVFEVPHLEAQSNVSHQTSVKGKSIFHAIQGRIPSATAPEVFDTNTKSISLPTSLSDDIEHSFPKDEYPGNNGTAIETPPEPLSALHLHSAHDSNGEYQRVPGGCLFDLVLAVPLMQARWSWSSHGPLIENMANVVSSKLAIWAQQEAQRLETERQCLLYPQLQPTSTEVQHNTALVLYKVPSSTAPNISASQTVMSGEEVPDRWYTKRIFFVDVRGTTRIIDSRKMMYDIEVMSDNGASDFDSVASPLKIIPRFICYSEPTTASIPQDSDDSIEIEDLGDFVQIGATFHTNISDWNDAVSTSDSSMNFEEDEDVIDPRLIFLPTKQVKVVELVDETTIHQHDSVQIIGNISVQKLPISPDFEEPCKTQEADLSITKASSSVGGQDEVIDEMALASPPVSSLEDSSYEEDISSFSLKPFPDFYVNLPDPSTFEDDGTYSTESLDAILPALPQWLVDNLEEDAYTEKATEAFSSDWASELMRMTLGTESFFTFLMQLDTIEENVTTEEAVVQAFLELVVMERKKLGRKALPSSYTPAAVLASKIVPHTIFLGTISLASLLAALSFDDERKVTVDDIYHVFKDISAADMHYHTTARKGVLGALGRRLGKIFV